MGENRRKPGGRSRRDETGRASRNSRNSRGARPSGRRDSGRVVRLPKHGRPRRAKRRTTSDTLPAVGRRRVRIVVAAVILVGLLLAGRAIQLSVTESGAHQALAAEQSSEAPVAAVGRGDIVTSDGRELATSLDMYRVIATPYLIENSDKAADALTRVIEPDTGQRAEEVKASITKRDAKGNLGGYSVVATVGSETAQKLKDLGIDGINLAPTAERVYPDGTIASQLVGYLGEYGSPFGGVEARYDKALAGGEDVSLTIDAAVQQELEGQLENILEEHRPKSAMGLVMRVDDGAIVALANTPGYDNNNFSEATPETQRNRVLTDPYEPGSTFKPFTMAAALEENAVTPESTFTIPDYIQVADRVIHDSEPHETEIMNPEGILEKSSNVGMIQVAQQLGGENLEQYIRRFGFGEPTGVDLWGEDPGLVPAYEDWSGSSIGNIPIGQGITVTPLQLVTGYAALINGGTRVAPHVLQQDKQPEPGSRVISQGTSDIVRGMLQNVVDNGSGHLAQIPGYTVGGKTGTSQKVDPETGAYAYRHISSFIGFAPASDPKYLTLIIADEPQTIFWGEVVAAPFAKEVLKFTLGYFNVPPDIPQTGNAADEAGVR